MSSVARGFLDEMEQNPPDGATLGVGKPWSLWKAYALPEVVDALYYLIRSLTGIFVFPEHRVEAFIFGKDKARRVNLECVVAKRNTLDAIGPSAFSVDEMLDKTTEA
jgi:hypothetical protein